MIRISDDQRRVRLGTRHFLSVPGGSPVETADALVSLHSSDPATVFLSCQARVPGFDPTMLERALYDDRELVRIYGMRRTLWVVSRSVMPLVDSSATRSIATSSRRRFTKIIEDQGVADDGDRWLTEVTPRILSVLAEKGDTLGRDLTSLVPELDREMVFYNKAGKLMGRTRMVTNTMVQLALEGQVTRGRPIGTWVSSQYHWSEMESWLGAPIQDLPTRTASRELIRRWLRAFGPGTETDIRWWTGWTARQAREALADVGAIEVDLDGGIGYMLADGLEPEEEAEPWVALLPSLDPTTMGWKERDWYLGDHYPTLFDRNGNAGPTIWVDGRVVGGWAQRKTGEIVYELLEDVGREASEIVETKAGLLQQWMGDVVVTPRFRSPHDKELAG